jgi:DNA processing protein
LIRQIDSPLSKGCHRLLKQGATLVESVEDVMQALGYLGEQLESHAKASAAEAAEAIDRPLFDVGLLNLSGAERMIYDCLGKEPAHLDAIMAEVDLGPGNVNAGLMGLRLKGLIRQLPGSYFLRK